MSPYPPAPECIGIFQNLQFSKKSSTHTLLAGRAVQLVPGRYQRSSSGRGAGNFYKQLLAAEALNVFISTYVIMSIHSLISSGIRCMCFSGILRTSSLRTPHSWLLTPISQLLNPGSLPLTPHSSLFTTHSWLLAPNS